MADRDGDDTEGEVPDIEVDVDDISEDFDPAHTNSSTVDGDGFQTGSETDLEAQSAPINNRARSEDADLRERVQGDMDGDVVSGNVLQSKREAARADDLGSIEDDPKMRTPATDGKRQMDEDAKEEKDKKRKLAGLLGVIAAFVVLLVILALLFKPDEGALARVQFDDNSTAPTDSPTATLSPTESTDAPTTSPTTPKPTVAPGQPTAKPTPEPTFEPTTDETSDPLISRLPCDIIKAQENVTWGNYGENNFKNYNYEGVEVCGDTWGGTDPDFPQRSQWSVKQGRRNCPTLEYRAVYAMCDFVGARLCTIDEMSQLVASGTGCGGDRVFVYSNTDCTNNSLPGKYMFDLGLRDSRQPYFLCEPDLTRPSVVRCCGDNY